MGARCTTVFVQRRHGVCLRRSGRAMTGPIRAAVRGSVSGCSSWGSATRWGTRCARQHDVLLVSGAPPFRRVWRAGRPATTEGAVGMTDIDPEETIQQGRVTRRQVLTRLGTAGAAVALAPSILAACGSDNSSKSSTATTPTRGAAPTASGGAATTASGGAATTASGGTSGAVPAVTDLPTLLGVDAATAGKGMTIDAGAVLALTGTGSYYGKTMSRGLDLAAKHIEAAGGPKINLIYLDHKSGDAAAGKAAITELGAKNVPAKFASYVDDLGVMLDGTAQYKIFTLDGGGGTSIFGQGKPYFW